MGDIVTVNHVNKSYAKQQVLKDVCVDFQEGKIHGLIGRNGSGKTQLIKVICGYVLPDSGDVVVQGKHIGHDADHPDDIGLLIESPGFLPGYSGLFNLQMLAAMNTKIKKEEIITVLSRVGLGDAVKKKVNQYSLGMRQRLGIAQAIMSNPQLLILDEPMNGLDNNGVKDMRQLLLTLKSQGKTIILASHFAQDIDKLCDTVSEMDRGVLTSVKA